METSSSPLYIQFHLLEYIRAFRAVISFRDIKLAHCRSTSKRSSSFQPLSPKHSISWGTLSLWLKHVYRSCCKEPWPTLWPGGQPAGVCPSLLVQPSWIYDGSLSISSLMSSYIISTQMSCEGSCWPCWRGEWKIVRVINKRKKPVGNTWSSSWKKPKSAQKKRWWGTDQGTLENLLPISTAGRWIFLLHHPIWTHA